MTHLKIVVTAAALAGGLVASAASATPLSPALLGATDEAVVERMAGGCGPGFHPNPWGVCRLNFYGPRRVFGGPVYRPYGYYRPRPVYRPYGFYGPRPFF